MRRVSCTFSVARRDWLVLGPTLNRSESRCWACPSIGLSKVRTHGPLRQRNSGSARLHNISVAVEEDATVFVVCKLSSKLVVRLTIHGDKDRRLEVGPWSLDVVAYVVAVLLRRESGCRNFDEAEVAFSGRERSSAIDPRPIVPSIFGCAHSRTRHVPDLL